MKDISSVKGSLVVNIIKDGVIVKVIKQDNLVVTNGKNMLATLLAGNNGGITHVRYGTSDAPVSADNTTISNAVQVLISDNYLYPNEDTPVNCVKFRYTFDSATGNGITFKECGLVDIAGTLFNRIVMNEPIVKDNTFSFEGFWTIEIL